jgi:predicted KAP-like P-loop ATPase
VRSLVLLNDLQTASDAIGYSAYAKALAELVESPATSLPLTVGLIGTWGSGKSSLLEQVAQELVHPRTSDEAISAVHVIRFNAWDFSAYPEIWPALAARIVERLEAALSAGAFWYKFWRRLRSLFLDEWSCWRSAHLHLWPL